MSGRKRETKRSDNKSFAIDNQTRLANKLEEWAKNEMKCTSRHSTKESFSADTLKHLCRGPLCDVWEYVTKHIKHADTVKKIRGNLILKESNASRIDRTKPVGALKKEHHLLKQTQSIVRNTTVHAEKTLGLLQNKVNDSAKSLAQKQQQVREIKSKVTLLRNMNSVIKERINKYYQHLENINLLRNKINTVKEVEKNLQSKDSIYSAKIEQNCQEEVKKLCDILEKHICRLMGNQSDLDESESDKLLRDDDKEILWSQAWDLLCAFPVRLILNSLSNLSSECLKNLQEDVNHINIEKDAAGLQFQYESSTGNLVDVSKPHGVLQSVAEILEDGQVAQLSICMATEKSRNNIVELQTQLGDLLKILDNKFRETFRVQKSSIPLANAFVKSSLQVESESASLEYLNKKQGELNAELLEIQRQYEEKEAKLAQIKSFYRFKEHKQKLIRTLIAQNVGIHEWINKLRFGIRSYVQDNLCSKYQHVGSVMESISKCVPNQISILKKLPSVHLSPFIAHNWNSFEHLSIYCLDFPNISTTSIEDLHLLIQVLHELKFPHYKSPESLLQFILKAKLEKAKFNCQLQNLPQDEIKFKDGSLMSILELNVLISTTNCVDNKQKEVLIPMLTQSLEVTNEGFHLCNQITTDLERWWNQPAKNILSSITIQDMTLQQCLDRWAKASAMITQNSLNL